MEEIFGKIPSELALNCDFREKLFDRKGNIIGFSTNNTNLSNRLETEYDYLKEESIEIFEFLKLFFEYDYKKRESAIDILSNKWLLNK